MAANREVENRRGDKTDVLVQYIDRDRNGQEVRRLAVVVEIKGSFHNEVRTAMQTQLAERYLRDYEADRGVYVVCWFNCDKWDDRDAAYKRSKHHTLEELRSSLSAQATQLTNEIRRVEAVVLDSSLH